MNADNVWVGVVRAFCAWVRAGGACVSVGGKSDIGYRRNEGFQNVHGRSFMEGLKWAGRIAHD